MIKPHIRVIKIHVDSQSGDIRLDHNFTDKELLHRILVTIAQRVANQITTKTLN